MNKQKYTNLILAAIIDIIILTGMLVVIKSPVTDNRNEITLTLLPTSYIITYTFIDTKAKTQISETPFVGTLHMPTNENRATDDSFTPFPPLFSGAKWIYLGPSNQIIAIKSVNHSIYGVSYRTQYVGKIKELMKDSALEEFGKLGWIFFRYFDPTTIIYYHPYGWFMLYSTRLCVDDHTLTCTTIWEGIKTNIILDFIQ
jgi:hypothetical protein